ncbi:hypothetical protein GWI33_005649 [Rhynchophorus ferrugineus]|uniref:Uncharacterized protein n=1 Tax=Rhynchophorus ferrugineus TaxID=354439 RepID=A0A834IJ22_RHYFE|nr:hypothetical protein GWI33_005649 [Rhynchophorus ferrugineus]
MGWVGGRRFLALPGQGPVMKTFFRRRVAKLRWYVVPLMMTMMIIIFDVLVIGLDLRETIENHRLSRAVVHPRDSPAVRQPDIIRDNIGDGITSHLSRTSL